MAYPEAVYPTLLTYPPTLDNSRFPPPRMSPDLLLSLALVLVGVGVPVALVVSRNPRYWQWRGLGNILWYC